MYLSWIIMFLPVLVSSFQYETTFEHYDNYMRQFHKKYHSKEKLSRFHIFLDNLDYINNHNNNNSNSYQLGLTHFTDMTNEEFKKHHGLNNFQSSGKSCSFDGLPDIPTEIDWRTTAVTPVKDQGQCGSCWAFSTTGALEGLYYIHNKELVSFSEQQLMDCSKLNHGCEGGDMNFAFRYTESHSLCSEEEYEYLAIDEACQYEQCSQVIEISGFCNVERNNEIQLKRAVFQQPVSVAIQADSRSFQHYQSGVFNDITCGSNLDHGVLVVGYGTIDNQDYWLVKNSWGVSWGDQGYIKLARTNSANTTGMCGIAMDASIPLI